MLCRQGLRKTDQYGKCNFPSLIWLFWWFIMLGSIVVSLTALLQEEELNELTEKLKEMEKDSKLLSERNKQVHSLERDLAIKEDMIHKLLAEKEQAELLESQVGA
jgi:uncharacterized protein involved in exopolysaccharide biosynthesis